MAITDRQIQVPPGDHSLVESNRLAGLEKVSEIAEIFGINADTKLDLATVFRVYRIRLGLTHVNINQKAKISRMTLRKIEDGEQLTIQSRTAIKLRQALGEEFEMKIRALGFVSEGKAPTKGDQRR